MLETLARYRRTPDDIDPHWAAWETRAAIDELVADPSLDVVRVDPHEDPPYYL